MIYTGIVFGKNDKGSPIEKIVSFDADLIEYPFQLREIERGLKEDMRRIYNMSVEQYAFIPVSKGE